MTAAPFNFTAFEDAVHAWASGAMEIQAVWGSQNAPQPEYPFCVLKRVSGPVPLSWDWEDYDEYIPQGQYEDEMDPEEEEEDDLVVQGHRVLCAITVSLRAIVADDSTISAEEYLSRAQAGLNQSAYINILHTADIGISDKGSVKSLDEFYKDAVMSPALLEVKFSVSMSTEEYISYIERVHVVSDELGVDRILGVDGDDK